MLSNKGAETLSHPRKYTIKKILIKSTSHGRPLKYYKARRKKNKFTPASTANDS
jgi:hypothetical protein